MKIRPKRTFGWFLENKLFYLYFVLYISASISLLLFFKRMFFDGLNRTVGWVWEFYNLYFVSFFILSIYFFGLLLLLLLKRKTNRILSTVFLIFVLIVIISDKISRLGYQSIYILMLFSVLISVILFSILFFQALFKRKTKAT